MPNRQSIEELLRAAQQLAGPQLDSFLSALAPEQRVEIEKLLGEFKASLDDATHDYVAGYQEVSQDATEDSPPHKPAVAARKPKHNSSEIPKQIGPFKILQPIGQGGMGQVFMAEQQYPVRRRVALKIIKTDTPTKEILARFEAERQALAMMDHQNIAKVLDAGITENGLPYFAMELVKGVPITEYCDQNKLSPNERLELFVQACRAIQHAHQKGIVHRDIKPSNMLVTLYDGKPVTKVIDFGLAKALHDTTRLTDKTMFTQFGQVVGTLEYMSPEQAEMNAMDVDTRTDVYSLGVILYELLTGSTPIGRERLRTAAFDAILRMIREEEAPRPSTRLSSSGDAITGISQQRRTDPRRLSLILRGDLDWIAMKALEKDRTRRYDGPSALADDVQRFLNDEAIEARPPSLIYQLQKEYRRRRVAFLSVCTFFLLLTLGLVGIGTMYWKAESAKQELLREVGRRHIAEESGQRHQLQSVLAREQRMHAMESKLRAGKANELAEYMSELAKNANMELEVVKMELEVAKENLKQSRSK